MAALEREGGLNEFKLREALFGQGFDNAILRTLKHQLHAHPSLFYSEPDTSGSRRWRLTSLPQVAEPVASPDRRPTVESMRETLYPWQLRALDAWREAEYRGVVQAVTGAGKTRVALAAAVEHTSAGGKVAIVVPSLELIDQWEEEAKSLLYPYHRGLRVGEVSGRRTDTWEHHHILITTAQTGYRKLLPDPRSGCLLIADEVHHYGSESWQKLLNPGFQKRLGLTATYQREDDGLRKYLSPYFGGVCYSVGYREALDEEVIAHFKIAFVGVQFSTDEQARYDEISDEMSRLRRTLIRDRWAPPEPFGDFIEEVRRLANQDRPYGTKLARGYLKHFTERRAILAQAQGKLIRLKELAPAIGMADRSILFTQTKKAAEQATERLRDRGIHARVLTSDMKMSERKTVFAAFDEGESDLLAAPKLLDEGVDVPSADLAIILASSRSRRQMIQRMGRVIRKKEKDGRQARIVIFYVEGTSEDPNGGAHQDFIDMITETADDQRVFGPDSLASAIVQYINEWCVRR